jgi:DNA repair protein RadC
MLKLGPRDREVFAVILLDARLRLIEYVELFEGSVDGAAVFPREVVRCAVGKRAAAVVLVHNHPSGGAEPSAADRVVTGRLREALGLVDVGVVDHFIVGERVCSMRERGWV